MLTEDEFDDGPNILNKPLNYITLKEGIDPVAVFPPKDDLWAWAHVHIDRNIVVEGDDPISSDETDFINKFKDILAENPDLAHSRLVSPRKLAESEGYHAFLIPTFHLSPPSFSIFPFLFPSFYISFQSSINRVAKALAGLSLNGNQKEPFLVSSQGC